MVSVVQYRSSSSFGSYRASPFLAYLASCDRNRPEVREPDGMAVVKEVSQLEVTSLFSSFVFQSHVRYRRNRIDGPGVLGVGSPSILFLDAFLVQAAMLFCCSLLASATVRMTLATVNAQFKEIH